MLTLLVVLATQTGRTAITDTIAGMVTGPGGRLADVTIRTQASSASPPPPPSPPSPPSQRPVRVTRPDVTLYTGVSTVYETNLTHAPASLESYGVLLGVGGDFRYRSGHTTL